MRRVRTSVGADPDPHQIERKDPDPHSQQSANLDPHLSDSWIRFRINSQIARQNVGMEYEPI